MRRKRAFTLIELIIVVVIIGILALIAIPKYFANVDKAKKNTVYANLNAMRQAILGYYATYGAYPANTWPIRVIIDGDTVINMTDPDPNDTSWKYVIGFASCQTGSTSNIAVAMAYKQPGDSCFYSLCADGYAYKTCTP